MEKINYGEALLFSQLMLNITWGICEFGESRKKEKKNSTEEKQSKYLL